ncbi:hypothetical protein F4780DRAFT_490059 [Xylariomycetidae sp. FL0641]|nr:hypothetical protein F4780DRAFT_490059 [Xylariomycetidae sp. FL0641]
MDGRASELALYNGVSNRSRGWKTKKTSAIMEPLATGPSVLRWDGASRSKSAWDNLRRDPELWYRDGNCYIHLYGRGQSRRGPAFKVPFSALLDAKCNPFIDRFMSRDMIVSSGNPRQDDHDSTSPFSHFQRQNRIELFIPAPPQSDKHQAYHYHLATRNFIAFIFRRSVVGENLGSALITLMHNMQEFRSADVDNVQDMVNYLDEEGYLALKSEPSHALAMLHFAEVFQLRDIYIDAFSHCCGMSNQLFLGPEYQLLSSVTRKLLHRVRVEMDLRLGQAGSMLRTFLHDEFSEAHMGLFPGARAHLERFRTLLHGLYAVRFGYYPPPSIDPRTTIFEVEVFRTMRDDFEALYQFLVDDSFDTSQSSPFLAQGGICVLQSVQAFDSQHNFDPLFHPLPLLPDVQPTSISSSRRLSWLNKQFKANQSHRENVHAALSRARNRRKTELLSNHLVRAYCKFEEDSAMSPMKADKLENLGPMDGRKVRWILIYSIYQTLRHATQPPVEVKDSAGAPYNLCISTTHLPPWREEISMQGLVRRQSGQISRTPSVAGWLAESPTSPSVPSFEITPDVNFLVPSRQPTPDFVSHLVPRKKLRKAALSYPRPRNPANRRSMAIFTKPQLERITPPPRKPSYHEIVIHGYGNGTKDVVHLSKDQEPPAKRPEPVADHTPPSLLSSDDSCNSSDYGNSEGGSLEESPDTSIAESPIEFVYRPWDKQCDNNSNDLDLVKPEPLSLPSSPPPAQRRARTYSRAQARRAHTVYEDSTIDIGAMDMPMRRPRSLHAWNRPASLMIPKANTLPVDLDMPSPMSPTAWDYIKAVMEVKASNMEEDIHPEWEQYNDLGGLTEPKSQPSAPQSLFRRSTIL